MPWQQAEGNASLTTGCSSWLLSFPSTTESLQQALDACIVPCRACATRHCSSNTACCMGAHVCSGNKQKAMSSYLLAPAASCHATPHTLDLCSKRHAHHPCQEGLPPSGPGAVPTGPAVGAPAVGCVAGCCFGTASGAGDFAPGASAVRW